jgi:hypothetical protein
MKLEKHRVTIYAKLYSNATTFQQLLKKILEGMPRKLVDIA